MYTKLNLIVFHHLNLITDLSYIHTCSYILYISLHQDTMFTFMLLIYSCLLKESVQDCE